MRLDVLHLIRKMVPTFRGALGVCVVGRLGVNKMALSKIDQFFSFWVATHPTPLGIFGVNTKSMWPECQKILET